MQDILTLFFLVTILVEDHFLNVLERLALGINITTLLMGLGLFINSKLGEGRSPALAIVLTLFTVSANVAFVLAVFHTCGRHSSYCSKCHYNKNIYKSTNQTKTSSFSYEMKEQNDVQRASEHSKATPRLQDDDMLDIYL